MMGKNFNYIFLFYDVGEKRVQKVFKVCKKYLSHHQNSVFRGEITPSKIIKLRKELDKIIVGKEDFITLIKMKNRECFEEESIGESRKIDVDTTILI